METLFMKILEMSITASYIILGILGLLTYSLVSYIKLQYRMEPAILMESSK